MAGSARGTGDGVPTDRGALDTAIQRLFAAGLTVQSVAASLPDDARGARLTSAVESIDTTIREVRAHMEQTTNPGHSGTTSPAGDEHP